MNVGGTGGVPGVLLALLDGGKYLWQYIQPISIVVGITLAGWIVEFIVRWRLHALTRRSKWRGGDALAHAFRRKITLTSLLLGLTVALNNYVIWPPIHDRLDVINKVLLTGFVIVLIVLLADVLDDLLLFTQREVTHPAVSIVDTLIRAAVYIIGAIIILQQVFSYDLGPALAALGVAGLAVSLALQSTLTDLISGIQIIVAHQIRPGEYVQLSTGEEGYVTDIGWRTTTIRQLSNNLVIVPNSKMTSTILVNYHAPNAEIAVLVDVGVAYDSDLEKVERITVEVARDVLGSVQGGVLDSDPFIRYNAFTDSRINFTVILRGREFTDQYLIKHEFIKRLAARYREEQIRIPFPTRTVQLQQSDDARQAVMAESAHAAPGE